MRRLLPALPLLALTACLPYTRAEADADARFELLWARDLSGFEQRIAVELQTGADDAWTDVGAAWLALASCEELPGLREGAPPRARALHQSLLLEDARRRRLLYHRGTGFRATSISGTMHGPLDDPDFFERAGTQVDPAMIRWPAADEAWADELPARIDVPSSCEALYAALFTDAAKERAAYEKREDELAELRTLDAVDQIDPPPPRTAMHWDPREGAPEPARGTLAWRERLEVERAEDLIATVAALDDPDDTLRALAWRARFHVATMSGEAALDLARHTKQSRDEVALATHWVNMLWDRMDALARLELEGEAPAGVLPTRRALALSAWAGRQTSLGEDAAALDALERAERLGVDPKNTWNVRYQKVRLLSRAGKWSAVVAFADAPPPPDSAFWAAFTWRTAHAMRRLGQTDRFMATAMAAFRDRPYRADPFLRAIYIEALGVLNAYPFEERTVELLEDMGDRSRIYERVEEYARVALDRGQPANAQAAASWLLARHTNRRFTPRYHAILALAAFLEDDPARFSAQVSEIAKRPAELMGAIPVTRRPAFFSGADAQLADVLRQTLPVMAEWGDGPRASARRQRWLELVIGISQDFVRNTPGSAARPQLIELYRIASSMLDEGAARAYPERVGQQKPGPLVLGTVRVEGRDLEPFEPREPLHYTKVFSLTLVPRDAAPPGQWERFWPDAMPESEAPEADEDANDQTDTPAEDAT